MFTLDIFPYSVRVSQLLVFNLTIWKIIYDFSSFDSEVNYITLLSHMIAWREYHIKRKGTLN